MANPETNDNNENWNNVEISEKWSELDENENMEDDYDSYEDWFKNMEENKTFSKEEIFNKLKSSENINKVEKEVKKILWKMEWRYANFIKEYYGIRYNNGIDWRIDADNPKSIFEKEYLRILEEINKVQKSINLASDEVSLLNFYENISEQLYNFQEKSSTEMLADLSDWLLSNKELMWRDNVMNILNLWSKELFDSHDNRKIFQELLKKKSDIQLIGECFNIDEWFWAFEDSYKELLRRLNWENLFKKIDDITSSSAYEESKDWTKDIITSVVPKSLFARWKISDFEKWINWYDKKDKLLEKINSSLANDSEFVLAFLSHIDKVQECEVFQWSIKFLEENSEVYKKYVNLKENYGQKSIEALQQDKNINFIGLYDNEDDWWWSTFFNGDIAIVKDSKTGKKMSKKYPGFVMDEQNSTENNLMKKVVFKKWNDSMTFVLLKTKKDQLTDGFDLEDMYKMALWWLDKDNYNVFALRWHCYTTTDMASALGDLEMVWEDDIIIDWWCWNYDNIWYYMEAWIKWEIFAYRGQWRWSSTEAFVNKLFEIKKNNWNYKDFLDWLEKQKTTPDSGYTKYIWEQIVTPNSAYSLYMKAKYEINNKLTAEDYENNPDDESWDLEQSASNSWEEDSWDLAANGS